MDNQHRRISGYRELSQTEIDLMNEVKAKGEELRALLVRIEEVIKDVPQPPAGIAHEADHPLFWLRYADGTFRSGVMYAVRAIAQPSSF